MPAKRGPAPKPPSRQSHRPDAGKVIPFALRAAAPPEPPTVWLASTRTLWDAYWASDMARAIHTGQEDTVFRLFTYRDEWQRSMNAYRKTRVVAGSTGQARLSPLFEAAMKLEDRIGRLGADLGMTPYALMRLGIATGRAAMTIEDLFAMAEDEDTDEDPRVALVVSLPGESDP